MNHPIRLIDEPRLALSTLYQMLQVCSTLRPITSSRRSYLRSEEGEELREKEEEITSKDCLTGSRKRLEG